MKQDEGLGFETELKNTMPAHLGSFILSESKRIMNNFTHEINGFKTNFVHYTDWGVFLMRKDIGMY